MTLRLGVYRSPWRARIAQLAADTPGLLPVVKGAGYGIGQHELMAVAAEITDRVGVGSVYELGTVPAALRPYVLTPALEPPGREDAVMTVGSSAHVAALTGWGGAVLVKLASRMHRFGAEPNELAALVGEGERTGLDIAGYSLHPPTATTEEDRVEEALAWAARLPDGATLSVSHLSPESYARVRAAAPGVTWMLRAGTALWHGDKSALRLEADVLDVGPVRAGERVGYRQVEVPADGTIAVIGAGTANGIAPLLRDGAPPASPFHFARRRLGLLELHMHAAMGFVPEGAPVPQVGDWVDVQRPLIGTFVDVVDWR